MDPQTFSLILLFVLAAGTGGAIVAISAMIGRVDAPLERGLPYECGLDPVGSPRRRFSVKFFLVAVLFIVFDVEVAFLYPWAVAFRDIAKSSGAMFVMSEIVIFVVLLALALTYAWGRGALDWEE